MKRRIICLFLAVSCLFMSGCSSIYKNYREIEQLQVIQTLGLDYDDGIFTLTIASGKPLDNSKPLILTVQAPSITTGLEQLQDLVAAEELFFSHTRSIIIGQSMAENCAPSVLDYVCRAPTMRHNIDFYVIKDGDAEDLIRGAGDGCYDITEELSSLKRDIELRGQGIVYSCGDIATDMSRQGSALACAISIVDTDDAFTSGGGGLSAAHTGFAILKNGGLAGFIDRPESCGACILMGKGALGAIVINAAGSRLTLLPSGSSASMEPVWNADGTLDRIDVSCSIFAAVSDMTPPIDIADSGVISEMGSALSRDVESWLTGAIQASQDMEADFLGIGGLLQRSDPDNFAAMEENWPHALADIRFSVRAECDVERTFDLKKPANGGDGSDAS